MVILNYSFIFDETKKHNIMNEELLKEAIKKRETKNILTDVDFDLPIEDFILRIYINCDPSKYGEAFQSYLNKDFSFKFKNVPRVFERADLHINCEKYFEVKISYLNKNGGYSVTHTREWQNFDFFILCFVDGDFNSSFCCVPKDYLLKNENLTFSSMNGTKKSNSENNNVSKRTSVKLENTDSFIKENSVLEGTTYDDLKNFIYSLSL